MPIATHEGCIEHGDRKQFLGQGIANAADLAGRGDPFIIAGAADKERDAQPDMMIHGDQGRYALLDESVVGPGY